MRPFQCRWAVHRALDVLVHALRSVVASLMLLTHPGNCECHTSV
jgi:hypothetical protein